jgi:enoyl-CoA hydratase/carnithine racemase
VSLVDYEVSGAVACITLDRPPVNALDVDLIAALDHAIGCAEHPAVRAVVLTGRHHFAAGADIKAFARSVKSGDGDPQASALAAVIRRLERLEKPTIAAVSGYALGGGLELVLGADFRFLADDAVIGQPEILLGIIPGAGGTHRLTRLVGYQRAKEMVLSGRQIGAAEALATGIADEVVPAADLLDHAMEVAAAWANGPTRAYWAAKRALGDGYGEPTPAALEIERSAFEEVFATRDAQAGIEAFVAKETPHFEGR